MNQTCVYIVGAGPGDPDLLTVKAHRLLQEAQVVVHDHLVSEEIMSLIPTSVKRFNVGKFSGFHPVPQDEINKLLIDLSTKYQHIVRLKGGDPLIFGRGGEEGLELYDNRIKFEFVPGITAASACATYAGIPLTHRGLANSVRYLTGHPAQDKELDLIEKTISDPDCTLVVYMGISTQQWIVEKLLAAGRDRYTPVAVIEGGTTPRQRRIVTTLDKMVAATTAQNFAPPSVLIIGRVVTLASKLSWFYREHDNQTCVA